MLVSWSPRDQQARQSMGRRSLPHSGGGTPILALDMYEHSYHMDFGAKAATYVDTFMEIDPLEHGRSSF